MNSGKVGLVGWFLLPALLKTLSVTKPMWHQVQAGARKLLWLPHSPLGATATQDSAYTDKLTKHQDVSAARGTTDFSTNL